MSHPWQDVLIAKKSLAVNQDTRWDEYVRNYEQKKVEQPCLAEACAREEIMRRGLPPGTPVPVWVSCPCPRCSPFSLAVTGA